MTLKTTPADKASIDAIVHKRQHHRGTYSGLAAQLRGLEVGQGLWIECPEGQPINRHQTHVAASAHSLWITTNRRFLTRRDVANNRVAVVRVE